MTSSIIWPLVDPNDDGIRPAGKPNECFYCQMMVGASHKEDCVMVEKTIEMGVYVALPNAVTFVGTWKLSVPHFWDADMCEFHKNDGSWCANNFLDAKRANVQWDDGNDLSSSDIEPEWTMLESFGGDDGVPCLCAVLEFEFERVVDATPRRALKAETS